jgi:hypothetical protein
LDAVASAPLDKQPFNNKSVSYRRDTIGLTNIGGNAQCGPLSRCAAQHAGYFAEAEPRFG